jgi:hypothetical protein
MVMSMRKDDHTKDDQAPSSNAQSGGRGKNKPASRQSSCGSIRQQEATTEGNKTKPRAM